MGSFRINNSYAKKGKNGGVKLSLEEALPRLRSNDATLTRLDMGYRKIDNDGANELAGALKENKTLMELDLSYCSIDAEETVAYIAGALKGNETLTVLNLSFNNIGGDGACALADALKVNINLTELWLWNDNVDADGARALANALKKNASLSKLNLRRNNISGDGAAAFAAALEDKNATLTSLYLGKNNIGAMGAAILADALKVNETLTHLWLSENDIGDEGVCEMAGALKKNTVLLFLDLGDNIIGNNGVHALTNALKDNASLTELDLSWNNICDEGADSLSHALRDNKALTELNLHHNNISAEGAAAERIIGNILSRNRIFPRHRSGIDQHGVSFYLNVGGNGDERNDLVIESTVWEAATGDGLALNFLHNQLRDFLADCGKDELKPRKKSLKTIFDTSRDPSGSPFLHLAAAKDSNAALGLCQFLVGSIGVDFDTVTDEVGRTARDIAIWNPIANTWAKSVDTFLGRYFIEERGKYNSTTCTVHFATDVEKPKGDPGRNVAIKIMNDAVQFNHELDQRLGRNLSDAYTGVDLYKNREDGAGIESRLNRFEQKYVLPLLRYHREDFEGNHYRCLVMLRAERNLDEVIRYEDISGLDINGIVFFAVNLAQALMHLHTIHKIVHADVKPRNIVRINGVYNLIDFDASVGIGKKLTKKCSSGYLPPELAAVKFRPEEKLDDLKKCATKLSLEYDSAPTRCERRKIDRQLEEIEEKIKQIDSKSSGPFASDTLPDADFTMDIWSYGVVMYQMLTGRSLFHCDDKKDDLLNDGEKRKLVNWETISDDDLLDVLKDCNDDDGLLDSAKDLLRKCLCKKQDRYKNFKQVLLHDFLNRRNIQSQELIARARSIEEKADRIEEKADRIEKKTDETLTELMNVARNVKNVLMNNDTPYLMHIIPEDASVMDWMDLKTLVGSKVKVLFLCPITYAIPRDRHNNQPMGYSMTMPHKWVKKYGTALQVSYRILQLAFVAGRLAGVPILSGKLSFESGNGGNQVGQKLVADNMQAICDANPIGIVKFATEFRNASIPNAEDLVDGPSEDLRQKIAMLEMHDEIRKLAERNNDKEFLDTGLAKVEKDGLVEYVSRDPNVKALYETHGQKCIGLPREKLEGLGIELDAVVKEGQLERRSKKRWKESYFVLWKSGLLLYYEAKADWEKDSLGAMGTPKPKNVKTFSYGNEKEVSLDDAEIEDGVFCVIFVEGGASQKLRGLETVDDEEKVTSRKSAASAWINTWNLNSAR